MKKSELRKIIKEELNEMATQSPIQKQLMDAVNLIDRVIGRAMNSGEMDDETFLKLYGINSKLFDEVERL